MHKRVWKTKGGVSWRRRIRKLVTLVLEFLGPGCITYKYYPFLYPVKLETYTSSSQLINPRRLF